MLAVIAFTSRNEYNPVNLYYDTSYKSDLFQAVLDDLARNGEIIALAFLSRHVSGKFRKSSYGLLAAKLTVSLCITAMIILILGEFALLTDYPFLSVGSYTGIRFLQRTDSIFMVLWTMTSVIAISLFLHIIGELIGEVFPKLKLRNSISAFIVFCTALPFIMTNQDFSAFYQYTCSGIAIILLAGIIPFLLFLSLKLRRDKK